MPEDLQKDIEQLKRDVEELKNGIQQPHVNLDTDLLGLFDVVSAAPTAVPRIAYDQIKIYVNGGTLRLYWYDWVNHAWHYVTATA